MASAKYWPYQPRLSALIYHNMKVAKYMYSRHDKYNKIPGWTFVSGSDLLTQVRHGGIIYYC